jgi:expansin (peptidoglycan-binding protein)
MKNQLRLGSLATLVLAAAAALPACGSDDSCLPGTSDGACNPSFGGQAGASGVGGAGVAGSGVAGSAPVAGSGVGGSSAGTGGQIGVAGSGGSGAVGGSGGVGGSGVAGSSAGGSGSGGTTAGGTGGTSGGGMAGTAGMGGMGPPPTVVGECKDEFWPSANNGSVTRYDFSQGTSLPACTYVITHKGAGRDGDWDTVEGISTGDGGYFGAMNTTDFQQGAACGACVEATYSGRKVVLTIVDECPIGTNPLCTKGHIDLSRKAIRQLEPNASLENLRGVNWKYVKCPAMGNVKARLHPNQNANWQPVVIENGLFPMKSVTINGKDAKRAGNAVGGGAWLVDGTKVPLTVRATDVNGNTITFTQTGPELKDVGQQFMCK